MLDLASLNWGSPHLVWNSEEKRAFALVYISDRDGRWPIGTRQGEGLVANFCRNFWHGWNVKEDGWDVWRVRLRCGEKWEIFRHVFSSLSLPLFLNSAVFFLFFISYKVI
jgi:hypothetical protein